MKIRIREVSPWTAIFIVTFFFQLFRKELTDSIIFGAATVIMLLQPVWKLGKRDFPRISLDRRSRWAVATAFGLLAAYIPRHHPILAALFLALAFLLFLSLWGVSEHAIKSDPVQIKSEIVWAVLALVISLWELTALVLARLSGDDRKYPTISEIIVPALDSPVARLEFAAGWILVGYLVVRHWRAR